MNDYEIISHRELERLRKEIEKIKSSYGPNEEETKTMIETMTKLNDSVNDLLSIFRMAMEMVKHDPRLEESKKIEKLIDENKKIAEGILTLGDTLNSLNAKIDNLKKNIEEISNKIEQLKHLTVSRKPIPAPTITRTPPPMTPSYGMASPVLPPPAPTE